MATTKSPQRGSQKKVAMRANGKLEGGKGKGEREKVRLYQYLRHGPGVYETRAKTRECSRICFAHRAFGATTRLDCHSDSDDASWKSARYSNEVTRRTARNGSSLIIALQTRGSADS